MSRLNNPEVSRMESEIDHPCPICGESGALKMLSMTAEIPYFGEHTQITLACDKCGLRQTDFIPAEEKGSLCHTLQITTAEHLRARVVRGSSATVRLPELDLEVSPGSHSTGYVSNVEGVLLRFLDIIDMVARQAVTDSAEGGEGAEEAVLALGELRSRLERLMSGDALGEYNLEILDPTGHSAIADADAVVRELSQEEVEELDYGPNPMVFNSSDDAVE